jgi:polyisoprenoid-binding protein YceI
MSTLHTVLPTGRWTLDPSRTTASFDVRNGFRVVHGTVPVTRGEVTHRGGDAAAVAVVLDLSAVGTGNDRRDRDLRKPSLLDLDRHPIMRFSASSLLRQGDGWVLPGTLEVRGREVAVSVAVTELTTDPDGGELVAAGTARLDRRDAGIVAPPFVIGRRVDVHLRAVLIPS